MSNIPDQKDQNKKEKEPAKKPGTKPKSESEEMQQRSDPQITELRGFIDPDEPLEVEGTDNPV